jgi:hypothetical protein
MKSIGFFITSLFFLISCNNPNSGNFSNNHENFKEKKQIINQQKVYDTKCIILYLPDSLQLIALEKQKSKEELSAIEYDKTLAIEFLSDKNIPLFIDKSNHYKFKKQNRELIIIDKSSYHKWGLILFIPNKNPKVIFLNDITEEYDLYF